MSKKMVEEVHGGGRAYKFLERNRLGEKIVVCIRRIKTDVGVGEDNHPKCWLSVTTLVTDMQGNTREKYNPQIGVMDGKRVVDRKWVLEPTAENVRRLLEQVERLAFGGQ